MNATGIGDFEICIVNTDGTGLQRLTDTARENTQPAWSPDGEWIVVSRYEALHVVSPAGDRIAEIANSPGTDGFPEWTD